MGSLVHSYRFRTSEGTMKRSLVQNEQIRTSEVKNLPLLVQKIIQTSVLVCRKRKVIIIDSRNLKLS